MLRLARKLSTSTSLAAMRGIIVKQFGGPEVLEFTSDLPSPASPTENQLLIRVHSAGVNPVDTYIRTGIHAVKPALPYTPGSDGAGVVEQVGNLVTKFKVGDRVYWSQGGSGSYAELALTDEKFTHPLGDSLSFQQGAALGVPYFSAYRAIVTKANLRPGETVLIHGASGAVGIASVQIARSIGANILGTAGTAEGLQLVLDNGANKSFNHRQEGYMEEIKKAANGKVDVIIEMLANVNLEKDLELASRGTRIIIVGSRGKIEIMPRMVMYQESIVTGIMLWNSSPSDWNEMASYITEGQRLGWVKPIVGQKFAIDRASDAHKEVIEHSTGTSGKIVLDI